MVFGAVAARAGSLGRAGLTAPDEPLPPGVLVGWQGGVGVQRDPPGGTSLSPAPPRNGRVTDRPSGKLVRGGAGAGTAVGDEAPTRATGGGQAGTAPCATAAGY